jgi:hypothetical protein
MIRTSLLLTAVAALAVASSSPLGAQVSSSLQSINLTAVKGESVTLGAPSPGTQSLTIVDGVINPYAAPFSINLAWDVKNSTSTVVTLVGYFTTPLNALENGADHIASSRVEVSIDGGTSWRAVTGTAVNGIGATGGSVTLFTSPVTQGEDKQGSQAVVFSVRLNLTGAPSTAAGTYSGTLNLMAISK